MNDRGTKIMINNTKSAMTIYSLCMIITWSRWRAEYEESRNRVREETYHTKRVIESP